MNVLIASDHAGIHLKKDLQEILKAFHWIDLGPKKQERVDYPDYARKLVQALLDNKAPIGVLICGTGIGMSIAANKFPKIRAAHVSNPVEAHLAREHNNANIVCIGARFLGTEYAAEIVRHFLRAKFAKTGRHKDRLNKIVGFEETLTLSKLETKKK